jgi:tyrosyl-tRNA synthetase
LVTSNAEANRKIAEGAVRVDGNKTTDKELRLAVGAEHILQLGPRRFARVQVSPP